VPAPRPPEAPPRPPDPSERGLTFLEMIATVTILMILASAILPLAKVTRTRQKEIELRRSLRTLRTAIDRYQQNVAAGQIGGSDVKLGSEGYPPDLETLVNGVNQVGSLDHKLKFIRRIPFDPMTRSQDWGLRCYQDEPDSQSWCGQNVYDVYTKHAGTALDGTKYRDW
jgi:general secretion pathway protein G